MTRNIYYFLLYFYLTLFYVTDQTEKIFYISEDEDSSSELSYYEDSQSSIESTPHDLIKDPNYTLSKDSAFYSGED